MSSFSRRSFLGMAAALGGCGFTPSYGPSGAAHRLQNQIAFDAPDDRDTYLLVRRLEERLGRPTAARFGLNYDLKIVEERMAVSAINVTSRFNVVGKATFSLRDLSTGEIVESGSVDTFTGYSATGTTVATRAAKADAYKRLMTILADQITARLIATARDLPA